MAKSEICGDCQHFSDVGRCRICATSKREYVGFFADACPLFTREPEQPAPEPKKEMENEKPTPTTKVCKKCGRELPLEQFHKNRWGYTQVCKECKAGKTVEPVQEYKVKKVGTKSGPSRDQAREAETRTPHSRGGRGPQAGRTARDPQNRHRPAAGRRAHEARLSRTPHQDHPEQRVK